MENRLQNKVLLLTGAGGGIGRAIAETLARQQMKIILFGGNNLENLEKTRAAAAGYTGVEVLPGDLTDPDFLTAGIEKAAAVFGGIDVLINNAGVAQSTPFENVTAAEFDRIMNINFKVPFFLTQQAIGHLKHSDYATIINIASVVGHAGYPLQSVYTASKHALMGFTKSIAREYFRDKIRVHAICPGGVYTDMVKISRPDLSPEGMIQPEDIASIVLFLLQHRGNAVIDEILVHRVNKEPFSV
ncbi:MAG: SDR family oxidoreductase [Lentisphaeria bacterium]|nr:SDR family oxidoreductase [Lentisphaeria bacterium]